MSGTRHIALLRGINVGKAKRIAMADLRALVERLGGSDVATLLNSGNVVFTCKSAKDLAARLERAIAAELGVSARVTVLTADELAAIVAADPLTKVATDPSKMLIAVLQDRAATARLAAMQAQTWAPDAFAVGERCAYLWCSQGVLDSKVQIAFSKAIGDAATARNAATMQKLLQLARGEGAPAAKLKPKSKSEPKTAARKAR